MLDRLEVLGSSGGIFRAVEQLSESNSGNAKLVDQLADFEEAVKDTAKSVGIKGEPSLVYPPKSRRSGLDLIFGDVSDYLPTREKLLEQEVGFYYLWK